MRYIYLASEINIMFQEKWPIGWESSERATNVDGRDCSSDLEREWVVAAMRCRQLGLEVVQKRTIVCPDKKFRKTIQRYDSELKL